MSNTGSSWRKWDLHVHTPSSIVASEYGGDTEAVWDKYIDELEALPEEIKVIGINDYLFIDGYKKVLEYKRNGRLNNLDLILPVVEFRLREFAGHEKLSRLNYHIIFANEDLLTAEQIETHFINSLRGKAKLSAEYSDKVTWAGAISKSSLEDLGRAIVESTPVEKRPEHPNFVQIGFDNINFTLSDVENILGEGSDPNTYLEEKYLKAIGKAEWEDFRWTGGAADKKTVINGAHIIFAASPDTDTVIKSKESLTKQAVNDRLLHCSDAHTFRTNPSQTQPKELGHCYTWIKADPTFEGLKQILYEPTRITLSDTKPVEPTNTIESISLEIPTNATITVMQNDGDYKDEQFCFADVSKEISLSPYFNCFVGGRGTGKSTILNFLGLHSSDENSSINFWRKLSPSFDQTSEEVFSYEGVRQFEFIGQSEVEKFATNKEVFTSAIYKRADILQDGALSALENELSEKLEKFDEYREYIEDLAELESELLDQEDAKETLKKSIKVTESKEYSETVGEITQDSNALQELESWREVVESYRESIEELQEQFTQDEEDVDEDVETDELPETELSAPYREAFEKAKSSISDAIELLDETNFSSLVKEEGILSKRIQQSEEKLSKMLLKSGLSEENIVQVKRAPQRLVQIDETISKLKKRIAEKQKFIKTYAANLKAIEGTMKQFEEAISAAIAPLNEALKKQAIENEYKDIKEIGLEYYLDKTAIWKSIADEFYSAFYEEFGSGERSDLVKDYIETHSEVFSRNYSDFTTLLSADLKKSPRSGYLKFLNEVFSSEANFDMFKTIRDRNLNNVGQFHRIQVTYNGKGIEHASFGQKCTAVVVILMLFGNYPLIIDEPEAHLDGSLIANYLVPLIKNTKKNRQIIFATHNANFVINGDAEKIVILKNDGKTQFIETTIEDEKHRSELLKLEGGRDAFKKRSDKLKIL